MPTILVVDDEAPVRFALEEALTTGGYAVIACASAAEARARAAEADVVVTDLVMPEVDGLTLLAELRRDEPDLPVVLLSARGSERIAAQAIKVGAWDYLPKPFACDASGGSDPCTWHRADRRSTRLAQGSRAGKEACGP